MVTMADRENEHAQLYNQMQVLIAEQAVVREQQQAWLEAARVQNRG